MGNQMNFAISQLDWTDFSKSVSRAPEQIKERLYDGLQCSFEEFSRSLKPEELTLAQVDHLRDIGEKYGRLQIFVRKHGQSMTSFITHLKQIVLYFNLILEDQNDLVGIVDQFREQTKHIISRFGERIQSIIQEILKNTKAFHKIIKQKACTEIMLKNLNDSKKSLKTGGNITNREYKKAFQIERKIEENELKLEQIDNLIKKELPVFLIYINALSKDISCMIICYTHNLYDVMNESFGIFHLMFKSNHNNIKAELNVNGIQESHAYIQEKIENMQLLKRNKNFYEFPDSNFSPASSILLSPPNAIRKRGSAFYSFEAQNSGDLSFSKGDVIVVVDENSSGWWYGINETTGLAGLFPSNYVLFT